MALQLYTAWHWPYSNRWIHTLNDVTQVKRYRYSSWWRLREISAIWDHTVLPAVMTQWKPPCNRSWCCSHATTVMHIHIIKLESVLRVHVDCIELHLQARQTDIQHTVNTSSCYHRSQSTLTKRKGKEEYLYSAFIQSVVSRCSDMDHTVLPADYTMPAFPL